MRSEGEKGQIQVVAVQEGNKNYYPSSRIRKTLTIGDVSAIKETSESSIKIEYASFGIRVKDTKVGELIQVYTLDGLLQNLSEL